MDIAGARRDAGPPRARGRGSMTRTLVRAGAVAVLSLALFVAGGIGVLRVVGPSGTAPRPAVAAARSIPPVVLTGTVAQEISSLQARIRALPSDWRSLADLGISYVQQARLTADPSFYPRAEGVLRRSLSLDSTDNFDAMTGMASLAAARHDFAGALEWGRRGEAVNSANADIHAITGDAFVELGRYPEAFGEFQRAVDLK